MFCTWSETQKFDFDLIAKTKAEADGIVLLVTEEEAKANGGCGAKFDDHEKWCIPKWLIWNIYDDLEVDEHDKKLVEFMKGCII